jgi:hypothetical protein
MCRCMRMPAGELHTTRIRLEERDRRLSCVWVPFVGVACLFLNKLLLRVRIVNKGYQMGNRAYLRVKNYDILDVHSLYNILMYNP